MDWIQSVGLGDLATDFFQKLSAAVNLLATPKETLLQVRSLPFLLSCLSVIGRVNPQELSYVCISLTFNTV